MTSRWGALLLVGLAACATTRDEPQVPSEVAELIQFEGADAFERRELLGAIEVDLAELERRSSKRSVIDDAAYSLEQFFIEKGFASARVEYVVQLDGEKLERARFEVAAGPRSRIHTVDFVGVERVPRRELLELVGWSELAERSPRWYSERAVRGAVEALRQEYAQRGFARAQIAEPRADFSGDGTRVRVVIEVVEDVRYFLAREPELEGGEAAIDAGLAFADAVGDLLTLDLAPALRLRIFERYSNYGHPDVRVSPPIVTLERAEGAPTGAASLRYEIEPGPRVVIDRLEVRGNQRTRSSGVTDELTLQAGDTWDARKERDSFRRLYRTGLFSKVSLRLEPPQGERRTLVVEVEEAPSSEFYAEPGFGSYEGLRLLLGWRERNLFGSGRSLELEALFAELTQKGLARLTDRHVFDSEFDANFSLFSEHRIEPSFVKDELGFGFGLAREFDRTRRITAEYRLRSSDVSEADLTDPDALAALQDVDISSVLFSPTWDTRDNVLGPSKGHLLKLFVEIASGGIGSELSFLRGGITFSRFFEIGPTTVVAASARTGVIAPIEDTDDIPLQERYFNGGENSVRSFQEDELGLEDSAGNPLGGEAYDVVSLELRQRLYGNLEGALFYDGGNVVDHHEDWQEFRDFRHALGVGVRYRLPIGPIRFDFGWNPDARSGEDDWAAHLSVGMAF